MRLTVVASAILIAAASLAGCESSTGTDRMKPGGEIRRSTEPDTLLSFFMSGPNKRTTAGYAIYKARQSNGTGTHTYHWLREVCYSTTECSPPKRFTYGPGLDSVRVYFDASVIAMHITVQITDSGSPTRTGANTIETLGPQAFEGPSGGMAFCGGTGANYFPFSSTNPDGSGRGPGGQQYYARACSGGRIWNDNPYLDYPSPL